MKLNLQPNDYINIEFYEETDEVNVKCGLINANGQPSSEHVEVYQISINAFFKLLGFNIARVKYQFIDFLHKNNAFLRVWMLKDGVVNYSICNNNTKKPIISSNNFIDIIETEVLKKGNNI